MLSTLLPNFLIGLREGLEAALVVSILVAFLVRTKRRDKLPLVWTGVGVAVVVAVVAGAALTFIWDNVDSYHQQELMGGILSIVAVFFVTSMIFWMRNTARHLKADITGKLESAITLGPVAIALVAFITVAREGLETTLFFWVAAQTANSTVYPLIGFLVGIAIAVVLAYLLYRSAVKINLAKFFRVTGAALIVVAAGIVAYGVHDLQEAGYLGGMSHLAWDLHTYDETSWYGSLLAGIFNFKAQTTWYQAAVWVVYLVPTMALFLWPQRKKKAASPAKAADASPTATTSRDGATAESSSSGVEPNSADRSEPHPDQRATV